MIPELMEIFKVEAENAVQQGHPLAECILIDTTVVFVNPDGTVKEGYPYTFPSKNKIDNLDFTDSRVVESLYRYSHTKYLESNKALKNKKIFSTTSNSFILKRKSFFQSGKIYKEDSKEKQALLNKDAVKDDYFDVLKELSTDADGNCQINIEKADRNLNWILEYLTEDGCPYLSEDVLVSKIENIFENDKDREICFFFEATNEEIEAEYDRYLTRNLYAAKCKVEEKEYQLSPFQITLNSKKPFFTQKSRKCYMPYLETAEGLRLQKKMFDHFAVLCGKNTPNLYVDTYTKKMYPMKKNDVCRKDIRSGYFVCCGMKKGVSEIQFVDSISNYHAGLRDRFYLFNYTGVSMENRKDKRYEKYCTSNGLSYSTRIGVVNMIFDLMFGININKKDKTPSNNLYMIWMAAKDIKLDVLSKQAMLLLQEPVKKWAFSGSYIEKDQRFYLPLMKALDLMILKVFLSGRYGTGSDSDAVNLMFNLKWSLKNYFKGKETETMGDYATTLRATIKNKIESEELVMPSNDTEYYYAVGHALKYLLSLRQGSSRNSDQGVLKQYIGIKNDAVLKEKIRALHLAYSHAILLNHKKANHMLAMVYGYTPEAKINKDAFLLGFVSNSIIYEKADKDNDKDSGKE